MAATGEFQNTVAAVEAPAPEKTVAKAAKKKPYFEMIKEAIIALKEKNGSSTHAIAKFMEENHKAVLPANFRKTLRLQLKKSASNGKLIKIKASYKLSEPVDGRSAKKPKPEPEPVKEAGMRKRKPIPAAWASNCHGEPMVPIK